jgi:hypothetical protein
MNRAGRLLLVLLLISATFLPTRAQNTGALPYLDSEHAYAITIGKADNNKEWVVTDKDDGNPNTPYTITDATQATDAIDWFEIIPATTDGGTEQVNITFDRDVFAPGGTLTTTWYLQYYEYDETNACISAREFVLTVGENEFYLTVGADDAQCNDRSGLVHTYAQVDNDPVGTDLYATEVTYTVTMHKEGDYDPDSWRFDASFFEDITLSNSITPTAFAATVSTVDGGSASFAGSGPYTVTVIPPPSADFPDEVEVTLTVSFENPVLADVTPTLTVSNGSATKNGTPPAVTYDNEDIYPYDPVDPLLVPGDREQVVTIYELPATRDIVHGSGETALSASNPLQFSTHNYNVEMEDFDSNNRSWYIKTSDGSTTMTEGAANDYVLTQSNAGNVVTATISYNESMATGDYKIFFEETNPIKGCSTVREYDISIGDPLNVSIALADAADATRCAEIAGDVNNTYTTATSTIIDYVVTLSTAGYTYGWSFDLAVSSTGTFDVNDVDVAASGIAVTGGSFTAGADNYRGSVSVAGGTTEVTISVTYAGFYVNEHALTVSLNAIEGTYADEAADVSVGNTIYALPQPLALEGVD